MLGEEERVQEYETSATHTDEAFTTCLIFLFERWKSAEHLVFFVSTDLSTSLAAEEASLSSSCTAGRAPSLQEPSGCTKGRKSPKVSKAIRRTLSLLSSNLESTDGKALAAMAEHSSSSGLSLCEKGMARRLWACWSEDEQLDAFRTWETRVNA